MRRLFNIHFWENKLRYNSWAQRIFLRRAISLELPANLSIEPTNACNLRCVFCPRNQSKRKIGFMDFELYQKIIDEVALPKVAVLYLFKDGESLLHPKISEFIAYAKRKKAAHRIEIYTNGVPLTKKTGRKLIKAGLDVINISLDAANFKTYFKLKKVDAYSKVVENVKNLMRLKKKLGAKNPVVAVKIVKMEKNKEEIADFKKMWRRIVDDVVVARYHTWEGSIKKYQIANSSLREISSKYKYQKLKRYACALPWLNPVVCWEGKVTACCVNYKDNELMMGDVKKQTLSQIWRSDYYKKLREAHLKLDFKDFPTCSHCSYWQMLPNVESMLKRRTGLRPRLRGAQLRGYSALVVNC